MREIKFRAWDKTNKAVKNVININFPANKVYCDGDYTFLYNGTFELMQYTGLKDKNGVEIYEGDIVKKTVGDYKLGQVVFSRGMFMFYSIGAGIYAGSDAFITEHTLFYDKYEDHVSNYEIIGNIYENPELLKDK